MATFVGPGQNDSGGYAFTAVGQTGLTWPTLQPNTAWATAPVLPMAIGVKSTSNGILYQQSGSVYTGGTGQIFPTGRS